MRCWSLFKQKKEEEILPQGSKCSSLYLIRLIRNMLSGSSRQKLAEEPQELWCTGLLIRSNREFHILRLTAGGSASVGSFEKGRVCVCPPKLWHKGLIWFYPDDS